MKTLINFGLVITIALFMSGCFAEKSYLGKVNIVAVGAGAKPDTAQDTHYIQEDSLPNIVVGYTPNISAQEQDVNDNVKYVVGDALLKTYTGEPKLLADYLNSYQKLENKVLILDKNGVVAWSGSFKSNNIESAQGVYDYGITGTDTISFTEAMEKFVLDGDTADLDKDKTIKFPKGNKESFMAGFSYSKRNPLLFTKLPEMTIESSKGSTSLSKLSSNNKPTVLVFFMSQGKKSVDLADDVGAAVDMVNMFRGKATSKKAPTPQTVLKQIENVYFVK